MAHFVIISKDGNDFVHAHPMDQPVTATAKQTPPAAVSVHTNFPRAGLYKLWAQFQRHGQIITVPYVVRVAEADKTNTAGQRVDPAIPDAVKVVVSANGYTPASINVRLGQIVRLAFYRPDKRNCGGKVVFPALGMNVNCQSAASQSWNSKQNTVDSWHSPVARQCIVAQSWSSN